MLRCPCCNEELTKKEAARLETGWQSGLIDVPEHLRHGLIGYVVHRHNVGGFLTSCLENKFVDAVCQADPSSLDGIKGVAIFIFNYIPKTCWGSPEIVTAWLAEDE